MVLFVNCHVVFHFLMLFLVSLLNFQLSLGNRCLFVLVKGLPTLLAICLFCGYFIVFVCLSLWCWELDVDLILSVPEFSYLLSIILNNTTDARSKCL